MISKDLGLHMTQTLDFYFDFSSAHGFLASQRVRAVTDALGRKVVWRPFLLGAVYQKFGGQPFSNFLKQDYFFKDFPRRAHLQGLPEPKLPENFPSSPVPPSRLTYWIEREAPEKVGDFVEAAYRSYWLEGKDTSDAEVALDAAESISLDRAAAAAGMQEPEIKNRVRFETERAIERGVFGTPFFIVDDEPFWGGDRLDDIVRIFGPAHANQENVA